MSKEWLRETSKAEIFIIYASHSPERTYLWKFLSPLHFNSFFPQLHFPLSPSSLPSPAPDCRFTLGLIFLLLLIFHIFLCPYSFLFPCPSHFLCFPFLFSFPFSSFFTPFNYPNIFLSLLSFFSRSFLHIILLSFLSAYSSLKLVYVGTDGLIDWVAV